jgi:hypothetical protein
MNHIIVFVAKCAKRHPRDTGGQPAEKLPSALLYKPRGSSRRNRNHEVHTSDRARGRRHVCAWRRRARAGPGPAQGGHWAAFRAACGQDTQTYCATAQSREDRHACVQANKDKFSDTCKSFMASHMHHGAPQPAGQ